MAKRMRLIVVLVATAIGAQVAWRQGGWWLPGLIITFVVVNLYGLWRMPVAPYPDSRMPIRLFVWAVVPVIMFGPVYAWVDGGDVRFAIGHALMLLSGAVVVVFLWNRRAGVE